MRKPRCIWCLSPVAHPGDTCSLDCYEQICARLAVGMPYLMEGEVPPHTLAAQPWYVDPRKEDDD